MICKECGHEIMPGMLFCTNCGAKVEKQVDEVETSAEKINDLFYVAPENKNVVSSIPKTESSLFDFDEALNPDMSLKDIMEDLMSEKQEDVKVYDENVRKIEESRHQSDIELLESGFINPRKLSSVKTVENKTIDNVKRKPTFDRRFLSIQNIVKDYNKK